MRLRYAAYAAAAVGMVLAIWAFWLEPASLVEETYEMTVPLWPAGCDGTRIAVLADLHVGSPFNQVSKLNRVVELTQAADPDLILLAGDYVIHGVPGGRFTSPEVVAGGLRGLSAPLGVFDVLGQPRLVV